MKAIFNTSLALETYWAYFMEGSRAVSKRCHKPKRMLDRITELSLKYCASVSYANCILCVTPAHRPRPKRRNDVYESQGVIRRNNDEFFF